MQLHVIVETKLCCYSILLCRRILVKNWHKCKADLKQFNPLFEKYPNLVPFTMLPNNLKNRVKHGWESMLLASISQAHYTLHVFEWIFAFYIIFHCFPWLQNDAKMQKLKTQFFATKISNVNIMRIHENICSV